MKKYISIGGEMKIAKLFKIGQVIGPLDVLIAAHALSQNLILVTNNKREFSRINHLKIGQSLTKTGVINHIRPLLIWQKKIIPLVSDLG